MKRQMEEVPHEKALARRRALLRRLIERSGLVEQTRPIPGKCGEVVPYADPPENPAPPAGVVIAFPDARRR